MFQKLRLEENNLYLLLILTLSLSFTNMYAKTNINYWNSEDNNFFLETQKKNNNNISLLSRDISTIHIELEDIRSVEEINEDYNAEAYPWISNDGLRIYFTKTDTDSLNKIFFAERFDLNSVFTNIHPLSINFEEYSNISCWLSSDELNIYFIQRYYGNQNKLFHSSRNNIEEQFLPPIEVQLLGDFNGFISGPSLTIDFNQLFIYNSDLNFVNILIFEQLGEDSYILADTLNVPFGFSPGPGQLTSDDLKYYFSLEDTIFDNSRLHVYERQNIDSPFDSLYVLENQFFSDYANYHQPSVSNNNNFIIFTRSTENSWSSNDLYISSCSFTGFVYNTIPVTKSTLSNHPNPFNPTTTMTFYIGESSNVSLNIYNIRGQLIKQLVKSKLNKGTQTITWDGRDKYEETCPSGIYLCKLVINDNFIETHRITLLK